MLPCKDYSRTDKMVVKTMHTMRITTITPAMVRFLLELKKLIIFITSLKNNRKRKEIAMHFFKDFGFPIGLPIFLILGSLVAHSRYKQKTSHTKTVEDFFERERLANATRKQDISNLDYLILDLSALPIGKVTDPALKKLEDTLTELSQKKILNLTGISNTDLKMMYGPANLDTLWECDDNYHTLSQTLLSYAKREQELGNVKEAIAVLEYASSLKIDLSQIYLLLNELYQQTGTPERVSDIYAALDTMDEKFRSYVLNHLESSHAGE